MGLRKLTSTDAFIVFDLDGAERADGLLRCAKKVLQDGARTMARSRTYSWALLGEPVSGASAAINAAPRERAGALDAFVAEMSDVVGSGTLALDAAKGVDAGDIDGLTSIDGRSPLRSGLAEELLAISVATVAAVTLDGLSGATVVLEGAGAASEALSDVFVAAGAEIVATGDGADVATSAADLLVCGSKLGLVDHELAELLPQRAVVACGPAPVTAKGLAVAARRCIAVTADFVTLAGPLLSFRPSAGATTDTLRDEVEVRIRAIASEVAAHPDGPYLGAAYRAEEFLRTWRDELPFGRPLA